MYTGESIVKISTNEYLYTHNILDFSRDLYV